MKSSNNRISRRSMLSRTAAIGSGLFAAGSDLSSLFAAGESRGFKIGACEWSLGKKDPSCFDLAKEIGLDGVQVDLGNPGDGVRMTKPEVRKAYLAAAKRNGLEIASLAMAVMNGIPLKSDPRAAKWLDQSIDICKALGITLTMPALFHKGHLDMKKTKEINHVVKVIKDVTPKAEKAGITIALENYLSAKDNMKIIERIGSPNVKVYYDVGNSTDKGYDIYSEIRELGKNGLLCEFHLKDSRFVLCRDKGRVDFKEVRKAMDDVDYRGWLQLESAHPKGVVADYRFSCNELRKIFPPKV
ncbi:MAG: sugar phosphate isomerase/epimerase [Pirellulales bacterium]|nr:sugar phosphate isomerase/epimerase [Pirellulales bacterium]